MGFPARRSSRSGGATPSLASLFLLFACAASPASSAATETEAPRPPRPAPRLTEGPVVGAAPEAASASEAQDEGASGAVGSRARPEAGDGEANGDASGDGEPLRLGSVAGVPLTAQDLLLEWAGYAPREVWLTLDKLVTTRLALAEAERLGLRLDAGGVELEVARERERLEADLRAEGSELPFEELVRERMGQDPGFVLARLRQATIQRMITERAVRCGTLSEENLAVRVIVVPRGGDGEEPARDLLERLAAGEDFAELAREHSVDDTAERGGLVPYLVRQEHSPLARLAFQTEPGTVGGPIRVTGHDVLLRVEEAREPREGGWEALREEVERSLAAHPIEDTEYLVWKLVVERRYPIDLQPLRRLLGASG